jgi:hypothetical protein
MYARYLSIAVLALGTGGCAVDPLEQAQSPIVAQASVPPVLDAPTEYLEVDVRSQSPFEDEIVCEREAKLGSHWKRRVCRTQSLAEQQRAASQEWLRTGGFSGSPTVIR